MRIIHLSKVYLEKSNTNLSMGLYTTPQRSRGDLFIFRTFGKRAEEKTSVSVGNSIERKVRHQVPPLLGP
jgi:hypothetical protein